MICNNELPPDAAARYHSGITLWLTWMKLNILHIKVPRYQVSVTSPNTVNGRHTTMTSMSATDKFTMNKLVTVRMYLFLHTATQTSRLPGDGGVVLIIYGSGVGEALDK